MSTFDKSMFDTLIYWMCERENIRLLKEAGEKGPWSRDPLFIKWRWCNVNRCHDRETRWIFKNIIQNHYKSPHLWFNLCVGRFINWSHTLKKIGYISSWDDKHFCSVIRSIIESGEKAYTGAYMIRAGTGNDAMMPKERYLCNRVFSPLWAKRSEIPNGAASRCIDWDTFLSQIFGMGNFMRNQIITDIKYTNILDRTTTRDWTTFCLAGPGTRRGMNRMTKQDLTKNWTDDDMAWALIELRKRVSCDVPFPEHFEDLNNLANCLCEFDKYMRLKNGEGEPRATYKPCADPLP